MSEVTIAVESPLQDDVRGLIAALNAYLLSLTPREACHHLTVEQMASADTTVFIARRQGIAVGCGALRRHGDGIGEVKRMYTVPALQGHGIGGRIVEAVEGLARREGFRRLVLETGDRHPAAWRVYERAGFRRCGRVLDYPDSSWSVFYEKDLSDEGKMRKLVSSGSKFEPILGFSRAVRVGAFVSVAGTAPVAADGSTAGVGDAAAQTRRIFEIVEGALGEAGASLKDVVRTRIMLRNIEDWKAVGEVHGEVFSAIRPVTCFVEVSRFINPEWLVEIEVDAIVESESDEH